MWFRKFIRPKKDVIRPKPPEPVVVEPPPPPPTLSSRLSELTTRCDIDAIVKDPLAAISLLTLYSSNCTELMRETITPSPFKTLVGLSLVGFFKDSHISPSLVVSRLAELIKDKNISNYAKHDIEIIIAELLTYAENYPLTD